MQSDLLYSITKHHTLSLTYPVESSTGPTTDYFDGIGACICSQCRGFVKQFFESALFDMGAPKEITAFNGAKKAWPIATGASGAVILGLLGYGTYLRPQGKEHGPLWRNFDWAEQWGTVALVDDCIFTGATMNYMQEQCKLVGLRPCAEIVLLGRRPVALNPNPVTTGRISYGAAPGSPGPRKEYVPGNSRPARTMHAFVADPSDPQVCSVCGFPWDEYNLHPRG